MAWVTGSHAEAPQGIVVYGTHEHDKVTWSEEEAAAAAAAEQAKPQGDATAQHEQRAEGEQHGGEHGGGRHRGSREA